MAVFACLLLERALSHSSAIFTFHGQFVKHTVCRHCSAAVQVFCRLPSLD
jgi:hypothetical protein